MPHLLAASKADYTLRIGPVSAEIAKGKVIKTTGYNGTIPGPMLRMKEGKPVTIDIFNDTTWPELVHWHGLNVSTKADGAEEEGSPYVMPKGQLREQVMNSVSGFCPLASCSNSPWSGRKSCCWNAWMIWETRN